MMLVGWDGYLFNDNTGFAMVKYAYIFMESPKYNTSYYPIKIHVHSWDFP